MAFVNHTFRHKGRVGEEEGGVGEGNKESVTASVATPINSSGKLDDIKSASVLINSLNHWAIDTS